MRTEDGPVLFRERFDGGHLAIARVYAQEHHEGAEMIAGRETIDGERVVELATGGPETVRVLAPDEAYALGRNLCELAALQGYDPETGETNA